MRLETLDIANQVEDFYESHIPSAGVPTKTSPHDTMSPGDLHSVYLKQHRDESLDTSCILDAARTS